MKLRITKGQIVLLVVLLPVTYVLSVGPLVYFYLHAGTGSGLLAFLYDPVLKFMDRTPLGPDYRNYIAWWRALPP